MGICQSQIPGYYGGVGTAEPVAKPWGDSTENSVSPKLLCQFMVLDRCSLKLIYLDQFEVPKKAGECFKEHHVGDIHVSMHLVIAESWHGSTCYFEDTTNNHMRQSIPISWRHDDIKHFGLMGGGGSSRMGLTTSNHLHSANLIKVAAVTPIFAGDRLIPAQVEDLRILIDPYNKFDYPDTAIWFFGWKLILFILLPILLAFAFKRPARAWPVLTLLLMMMVASIEKYAKHRDPSAVTWFFR